MRKFLFVFLSASVSKEEKDENVDSGVSADKSESASSEDRATTAVEAPVNNEVLTFAPSSSNIHAILLNIRHPRRRFYRKHRTPIRDSDSDSSRDSDDLSVDEAPQERANNLSDGDSATDLSNGMPSA